MIDLQEFKQRADFVYQFQDRDFLIEQHSGYQAVFFRTDVRESNPHMMFVSESLEEPEKLYGTLEHFIARAVSRMMGLG